MYASCAAPPARIGLPGVAAMRGSFVTRTSAPSGGSGSPGSTDGSERGARRAAHRYTSLTGYSRRPLFQPLFLELRQLHLDDRVLAQLGDVLGAIGVALVVDEAIPDLLRSEEHTSHSNHPYTS